MPSSACLAVLSALLHKAKGICFNLVCCVLCGLCVSVLALECRVAWDVAGLNAASLPSRVRFHGIFKHAAGIKVNLNRQARVVMSFGSSKICFVQLEIRSGSKRNRVAGSNRGPPSNTGLALSHLARKMPNRPVSTPPMPADKATPMWYSLEADAHLITSPFMPNAPWKTSKTTKKPHHLE